MEGCNHRNGAKSWENALHVAIQLAISLESRYSAISINNSGASVTNLKGREGAAGRPGGGERVIVMVMRVRDQGVISAFGVSDFCLVAVASEEQSGHLFY